MQTVNTVKTAKDRDIESITREGKTYYVCCICGRLSTRKVKSHGHVYCNKHYKQVRKYGRTLDCNPRTTYDRNECHINGDITYIDIYDKRQNVIAQAIIDTEDLPRVRYVKWKLSAGGYAINTPKHKGGNIHMSRLVLDTDQMVDHINHDTLDNRKANLRVVTKSQNQMNSDYRGVTTRQDGRFYAHIKLRGKMLNLGVYVFQEEALYARWYAETQLFGEYRYPKPEPILPNDRKASIRSYVNRKVQRL